MPNCLLQVLSRLQQKQFSVLHVGVIGYIMWFLVSSSNVTTTTPGVSSSFMAPPPSQNAHSTIATRRQQTGLRKNVTMVSLATVKPKIFHCGTFSGFQQYKAVMDSVFPEYEWVDVGNETITFDPIKTNRRGVKRPLLYQPFVDTHTWDLFINHWDHTCPIDVFRWLWQWFQGKSIFVYPESPRPPRPIPRSNFIELGPHEAVSEDHNHVLLTFLQATFWEGYNSTERLLITNHSHKQRNTGEHFLIYANSNCVKYREEAYRVFSRLGREVFHAGKCWGDHWTKQKPNSTYLESDIFLDSHQENRHLFRTFRFCLVLEHDKTTGYMTEKILNAFTAGCIPIYYGTEEIYDIFNRNAFVFYNPDDSNQTAQQVLELDSNPELYEKMMREPILAHGEATIRKYFSFDNDWGGGYLNHRIRSMAGVGFEFDFA